MHCCCIRQEAIGFDVWMSVAQTSQVIVARLTGGSGALTVLPQSAKPAGGTYELQSLLVSCTCKTVCAVDAVLNDWSTYSRRKGASDADLAAGSTRPPYVRFGEVSVLAEPCLLSDIFLC